MAKVDPTSDENNTLVYRDYNRKELYQKMNDDEANEFEIDEYNYNEFSKYKVIFNIDGSNYIFDNIIKVK